MKKREIIKRVLLIIFLVVLIGFGCYAYKACFNLGNYDESQIKDNHKMYFNIGKSNYIEENYERYIAYRKLHNDYTDEQIITYVNIGLDNEFYTNMIDTDMNDGRLIICNKYHKLKSDYVPDLVSLNGYGGGKMEREAAEYFKKMSDEAKKDGLKIQNVSGYRSYWDQDYIYKNYVSRDGQAKADTYSARAGTSEHQTGLATDINSVSSKFENTKEFKWLSENAYKYGFILRYPKGKEHITGYMYEPWHYRYVGIDVANIIHEMDITFDEYYATYILKG